MDKFLEEKVTADDVQKRIIDRLGSRQGKIERIALWERGKRHNLRTLYVALSAAACIALAVVSTDVFHSGPGGASVIEQLGIEAPTMAPFRAAMPEVAEIERLMDDGEFYDALDIADAALKKSNKAVKGYEKMEALDEETEYEYKYEKLLNSELRWTYIYLLVIADCERDALKELKKYLKDDEFCLHRDEAESMVRAFS